MSGRHLTVVTAGVGRPSAARRLGDRIAAASVDALQARGVPTSVAVVEVRDHAHDLVDRLLDGRLSAPLRAATAELDRADAVVAVTPVFTASYSALFKLFFEVADADALQAKPVLMAATAGVTRHALALEHAVRPMFACLRMLTVPTAVFAGPGDDLALAARIDRAAAELAALVLAATPAAHPLPAATG